MWAIRHVAVLGATILTILGSHAAAQPSADTLGIIRARGTLVCAVAPASIGFAAPDSRGVYRGLDVDMCRAVAAAILGDAEKVRYVPATPQQRFTLLQSGEVDLLSRTTTWTLTREATLGLAFAGINFYDGQGFVVRTSSGITSALGLDGATLCLQPGTTSELNVSDYFRSHNMRFTPVLIDNTEELRQAFVAGRCDAYSTDTSTLASFRAGQGTNAAQYTLLPETISKEPLGPMVRKGDWRFFDVVRWSLFAMLTAEELGLTSENIGQAAGSANPDVQRFVGRSGDLGRQLGVTNDFASQIVRQVGNFGESWEQNMTPIGIPRGINNLWNRGGLHYAPPLR
jgi:general L-amino acid transport system substrate-binding protein